MKDAPDELVTLAKQLREWALARRRAAITEVNDLSRLLGLPGVKVRRKKENR